MSLVEVAMRRASSGKLDKAVAAVAALAAGAAVFLMPGGILEQAVLASGLPDMLPQLTPPLGIKSRAGLALLSAGSAFGTALLMLRILGFLTKGRGASPAVEEGMPRTRRRDRHPDAPMRAPLSISRDLGEPPQDAPEPFRAPEPEPFREPQPEPAPFEVQAPRMKRPATRRRAPLIEVLGDMHDQEEAAPAAEEPRRIKPGRDAEDEVSQPAAPAVVAAPEPEPEPVAEETSVASAPQPERAREPQPEPEPVSAVETPQPQPAWLAAEAQALEAPAQENLAELLARFERALERKAGGRRTSAPAARSDDEDAPAEDGMDLRLRSALENLRRFAPSRG